jgi:nitrous oxide reductase accessory protein NosL
MVSGATAGELKPQKPEGDVKCPVCGMFVAKYPDYIAQVIFKDESRVYFDGAKDMSKYLFNLKQYSQGRQASEIEAVWVTDYYSLEPIDGKQAIYVIGSDVFGPMGRELIPFKEKDDADEFMVDHSGKSLLKFDAVTPQVIQGLD